MQHWSDFLIWRAGRWDHMSTAPKGPAAHGGPQYIRGRTETGELLEGMYWQDKHDGLGSGAWLVRLGEGPKVVVPDAWQPLRAQPIDPELAGTRIGAPAAAAQARSLGDIVEAVRDGLRPDYEDLRYAICALTALQTFDRNALMRLAEAEREKKKPFLTTSALYQAEEHCRRTRSAMAQPPRAYVGWNHDPENPAFLEQRRQALRMAERFAEKAAHAAPTPTATTKG